MWLYWQLCQEQNRLRLRLYNAASFSWRKLKFYLLYLIEIFKSWSSNGRKTLLICYIYWVYYSVNKNELKSKKASKTHDRFAHLSFKSLLIFLSWLGTLDSIDILCCFVVRNQRFGWSFIKTWNEGNSLSKQTNIKTIRE